MPAALGTPTRPANHAAARDPRSRSISRTYKFGTESAESTALERTGPKRELLAQIARAQSTAPLANARDIWAFTAQRAARRRLKRRALAEGEDLISNDLCGLETAIAYRGKQTRDWSRMTW